MNITHDILSMLTTFFCESKGLLFCCGVFWLTFIFFLCIYALIYKKTVAMMSYVTLFSLFFYYKTNGLLVFLLLATAGVSWWLGLKIAKAEKPNIRKAYLWVYIASNILILIYFKYTNFLLDIWNDLFQSNFSPLSLFLPVGISFYTFQSVSYAVDVYQKKVQATRSPLQFLFYLSFFPLLLAGPITRAGTFFPQIRKTDPISQKMIYAGLWMIIIGIIKKAVIADYLAQYNNWIFDSPLSYSGFECFMGVLGYTVQIYCDFSGYSDMSIGIASIMGFQLMQNFNFPYRATNLSDFWRRWHISLSTWLRDYIYIPLGGNRKGKTRMYINNLLTMLIAGLWHGASWIFIFWGALHGVGLVVQKMNKKWLDRLPDNWLVRLGSWLLTFSFLIVAWVFFRSPSFEQAFVLLQRIVVDFDFAYFLPFLHTRLLWCVLLLIPLLCHFISERWYQRLADCFIGSPWLVKVFIFLIVVQLVLQLRTGNVQPFIYYQF